MAIILSIETATSVGSVALHQEGVALSHSHLHVDKSHATALLPMMEGLLATTGLSFSDIDAIAISQGPGSYTGLRIGSSTVKGLCFSLEKPLIAVPTLAGMAKVVINQIGQLPQSDFYYCPMIDARRMEVFCAIFDQKLNIIEDTAAVVIDENSFEAILSERKVLFFGDGAMKCKPIIRSENAIFLENILPNALTIGEIAWQKWLTKETEEVAYFEPFYLKEFKMK